MKKTINSYLIIFFLNKINSKTNLYKYNNNNNLVNYQYDIFFLTKNNNNKFLNFKFFQLYTLVYLQNIYKLKLQEKNINCIDVLPMHLTQNFLFKVRYTNFKQLGIKYFNEVGYLFLVNIWLKNIKNICKYIKKKLDSVHFKKHRSYFLFFFKVLNKYVKPYMEVLQIKGIYLVFRGKLGKGGNSRKKTMFYKTGLYSLSNKMLALNTQKWDIWTKTGTVGCTMRLFYKIYDNLFKFLYLYLCDNIISNKLFTYK